MSSSQRSDDQESSLFIDSRPSAPLRMTLKNKESLKQSFAVQNEFFVLQNLKVEIKRDEGLAALGKSFGTETSDGAAAAEEISKAKRKMCSKVVHYLLFVPIEFACKVSIPVSDTQLWNKNYAAAQPLACYLTCLLFTGGKLTLIDKKISRVEIVIDST